MLIDGMMILCVSSGRIVRLKCVVLSVMNLGVFV